MEMARAAESTAAIAARPGQNGDPSAGGIQHSDGVLGQIAPGVLHHLQDAKTIPLYRQAVHLPHLVGGDRGRGMAAFR